MRLGGPSKTRQPCKLEISGIGCIGLQYNSPLMISYVFCLKRFESLTFFVHPGASGVFHAILRRNERLSKRCNTLSKHWTSAYGSM